MVVADMNFVESNKDVSIRFFFLCVRSCMRVLGGRHPLRVFLFFFLSSIAFYASILLLHFCTSRGSEEMQKCEKCDNRPGNDPSPLLLCASVWGVCKLAS
jgi:hypothetical protein